MWCGFTSRSFVSVIPLYCGNSLWRMLKLGKVFAIEYVVGFLRAPGSIGISVTDADHSEIVIRTSLVSYSKEREMVGFR